MSSSKYTFVLDLHSTFSQITLPVSVGDTDRELVVSFSDGGRGYDLNNAAIAHLSVKRPSKTEITRSCVIDKENGTVSYEFEQDTCPIAGLHNCQITLYNESGKKIASPRFALDAAERVTDSDDITIPDETQNALDEIFTKEILREQAERGRAEAEALRDEAETLRAAAEEERQKDTAAAVKEIGDLKTSLEKMRDDGEFDGEDGISVTHRWEGTVLTVTSASGTSSADLKGEKGEQGAQGVQGIQGVQGPQGVQGIQGVQGEKGEKGDGFSIAKTYSSVAEMNANFATDGIPLNALVLINTGNVNDVDNAKLFIKHEGGYSYLTDLSGAQGIKGEKGEKGDPGEKGEQGEQGPQGEQGIQGVQGEKGDNGADGNDGADGEDGKTPYIQDGYWYIDGVNTDVKAQGDNGVGISKVEKTATSGKVDTYTITFTNGNTSSFTVTNGKDGADGKDGTNGTNGVDGKDGEDYVLTDADRVEIAEMVEGVCVAKNQGSANVGKILVVGTDGNLTLADMPEGGVSGDVVGTLDDSNNILLAGNLADGTYTLKYENADGTYTEIGSLVVGAIEPAEPKNFSVAGEWADGERLSISSGTTSTLAGHSTTNYIPCEAGDELSIKGLTINTSDEGSGSSASPKIVWYDASKGKLLGLYGTAASGSSQCYGTKVAVQGDVSTYTIAFANDGNQKASTGTAFIRIDGFLMDGYTKNDVVINIKRNGEWITE